MPPLRFQITPEHGYFRVYDHAYSPPMLRYQCFRAMDAKRWVTCEMKVIREEKERQKSSFRLGRQP